jgi:hypothetical protein
VCIFFYLWVHNNYKPSHFVQNLAPPVSLAVPHNEIETLYVPTPVWLYETMNTVTMIDM